MQCKLNMTYDGAMNVSKKMTKFEEKAHIFNIEIQNITTVKA